MNQHKSNGPDKDRIDDPRIKKLYSLFATIRMHNKATLPATGDRIEVTFDFKNMGGLFYQFRVRFSQTERMLKFIVPIEDQGAGIVCHKLVKTDNIVRDIEDIYIIKNTLHYDDIISREVQTAVVEKMEDLYTWGVTIDEDFSRATRPTVFKIPNSESEFKEDQLYYGLITQVEESSLSDTKTALDIRFLHGVKIRIVVDSDKTKMYNPGKLYLINSNYASRVFQLVNALSHVIFEREALDEMKAWIAARKEEYHGKENQ